MAVSFGDFAYDPERRQLLRLGEPVPLETKAYELLGLLLARRPNAVSKSQIHAVLWPGTFVSESALARLVSQLRDALGDDARSPCFVRTVHAFGYAFAAVASEGTPSAPPSVLLTARLLWGERLIPLAPGENLVGRDEGVSVRVDVRSVSRRHARITVAAGNPVTLEDLGSKNGTWVGQRRLASDPVPLRDGDVLRFGRVELVFLGSKEKGSTQTVVD
jgi:DNA-binding winged helix-turn-helix (wHTH) protein